MNSIILLIPLLLLTPTIAHALSPYQSGYKRGLTIGDVTTARRESHRTVQSGLY